MLQIRIADPHFRKPEIWISNTIRMFVNMVSIMFGINYQEIVLLTQTYTTSGETLYIFALKGILLPIVCVGGSNSLYFMRDGIMNYSDSMDRWMDVAERLIKKPYSLKLRKPYSADYRFNLLVKSKRINYMMQTRGAGGAMDRMKEGIRLFGEMRVHEFEALKRTEGFWVKWDNGLYGDYTLNNE